MQSAAVRTRDPLLITPNPSLGHRSTFDTRTFSHTLTHLTYVPIMWNRTVTYNTYILGLLENVEIIKEKVVLTMFLRRYISDLQCKVGSQ